MTPLMRKLCELLEEVEVSTAPLTSKVHYGNYDCYDNGEETIRLNLDSWICKLFLHEVLHSWHPDWSEGRVEQNEDIYLSRLTRKEIRALSEFLLSLRK